jgi:hypothetical protein
MQYQMTLEFLVKARGVHHAVEIVRQLYCIEHGSIEDGILDVWWQPFPPPDCLIVT